MHRTSISMKYLFAWIMQNTSEWWLFKSTVFGWCLTCHQVFVKYFPSDIFEDLSNLLWQSIARFNKQTVLNTVNRSIQSFWNQMIFFINNSSIEHINSFWLKIVGVFVLQKLDDFQLNVELFLSLSKLWYVTDVPCTSCYNRCVE